MDDPRSERAQVDIGVGFLRVRDCAIWVFAFEVIYGVGCFGEVNGANRGVETRHFEAVWR